MAKKNDIYNDIYQLSRLALIGNKDDIFQYIKRISYKIKEESPENALKISTLLSGGTTSLFRGTEINSIPFDKDNRTELLQYHDPIPLEHEPIWGEKILSVLDQIVRENKYREKLFVNNISKTKSLLFYGPPGVGKTFAAKWLAWTLNLPLLILDLSSVMSSFLGRTGNNIKNVFDYAKKFPSILLLDEMDAIAKKRDDLSEIGELKRLVTVLLQEIDSWPDSSLLVAATNHPDLLDTAVWRRFDIIVEFGKPKESNQTEHAIDLFFGSLNEEISNKDILISLLNNYSYSEIEKFALQMQRRAIVYEKSINYYIDDFIFEHIKDLNIKQKKALIVKLLQRGYSQRKISELLEISRPTIKKLIDGVKDGSKNEELHSG